MRSPLRITRRGQTTSYEPDLHTQLEELLNEVWAQEAFERTHPFTCATMRERPRRRPVLARTA